MNKDKYYIKREWGWNHSTPLKCIVNPVLRKLQFWTWKPYVISSMTEFIDGKPHFIRYVFQRVRYFKNG